MDSASAQVIQGSIILLLKKSAQGREFKVYKEREGRKGKKRRRGKKKEKREKKGKKKENIRKRGGGRK